MAQISRSGSTSGNRRLSPEVIAHRNAVPPARASAAKGPIPKGQKRLLPHTHTVPCKPCRLVHLSGTKPKHGVTQMSGDTVLLEVVG